MSLYLKDLWWQVQADYGGILIESIATSGSTTTIVDTASLPIIADDLINKGLAYILTDADGASAAPEGEIRSISDFVRSTGTITVGTAFSVAIAVGDTYRVWCGFPVGDLRRAAQDALRASYPDYYAIDRDTSLAIVKDQYEYACPSGISFITNVEIANDADDESFIAVKAWYQDQYSKKLVLSEKASWTTGYTIRLTGLARIAVPTNDTTAIDIDSRYEEGLRRFVGAYGSSLLHLRSFPQDAGLIREHLTMVAELKLHMQTVDRQIMPRPKGRTRYPWYD